MPKVAPESISENIKQGMKTSHLEVDGDGEHFVAVVVSEEFATMNRVQRHQRVYQTLGDRMREEVHALQIKAFTPEEWEKSASQTS